MRYEGCPPWCSFLPCPMRSWTLVLPLGTAKDTMTMCDPRLWSGESKDNQRFNSWGGPGRGAVEMEGEGWQNSGVGNYVPTPPFAEYVSGHSTFSRSMSEIVKCFFGDLQFETSVCIPAGGSKIEGDCDPPLPEQEVVLSWTTVDEMADQAGISRQYGGIHFEDGDLRGRELGRKVALCAWEKACEYLAGTVGQ